MEESSLSLRSMVSRTSRLLFAFVLADSSRSNAEENIRGDSGIFKVGCCMSGKRGNGERTENSSVSDESGVMRLVT